MLLNEIYALKQNFKSSCTVEYREYLGSLNWWKSNYLCPNLFKQETIFPDLPKCSSGWEVWDNSVQIEMFSQLNTQKYKFIMEYVIMAEKSLSYPRSWILSSEVKQLIFGIPVKAWKSTYMSKFYEQLLLTSAEYELNLKKNKWKNGTYKWNKPSKRNRILHTADSSNACWCWILSWAAERKTD